MYVIKYRANKGIVVVVLLLLCCCWRLTKAPSTRIRFCLKTDIVSLWLGLSSIGLSITRIRWKRSPQTHLFKNVLQRGDFWKRRLLVYDDVIHHMLLAWRMLIKECYRISIVLAFSYGRAKTILIRYVWMRLFFFFGNGEKISAFKNIWIRADEINLAHAQSIGIFGGRKITTNLSGLLLRCPTTFLSRCTTVTSKSY